MKTSERWSLWVSLAIALLLFLVCVAGFFVLPWLTKVLIDLPDTIGSRELISQAGCGFVLALAYGVLATILLIDTLMIGLLVRVKAGKVFTEQSVMLIRGMSWSCVLLAAVFCGLGVYFQLAFLVAFAAVFLGLCLRVVKNVIEEATRIKTEHDMTV